ncbi:NADH-quinone oxidoreductase subunit C [Streptomyces sp. NPDC059224]|uniref:NADH-quinone oxidoreductase subunit C n=1 Tax=Streptomyces sp. NPDC059224 TaxID=3346775 RepID=UPI0036AAB7C9
MTAPTGWLPAPVDELFGPDATAEESYEVLTVDVPPSSWLAALETARTTLRCTFFDWMSAVDEPGTGFRVSAHVVALAPVRRLLVRTTVPHSAAELPSAVGVYAGARWHERETHEMFGVRFSGHPGLDHLLLPETFEGHPLRKDFVLAARVAKAWPGAKEPGESDHGGPRRRQILPPGVPDPNEWGPLKGQLPPAPARPARAAAPRATGERPVRAAGERPARRSRTAAEGSAGQTTDATDVSAPAPASAPATEAASTRTPPPATPRRGRSATEGSASQRDVSGEQTPVTPRRGRSVSEGSASQRAASAAAGTAPAEEPTGAAPRGPRRARTASGGSASQRTQHTAPAAEPAAPARPSGPRSPDAPWHHARPAFDEAEAGGGGGERRDASPESTESTESTEPVSPAEAAEDGQAPEDSDDAESETAPPDSAVASGPDAPPSPEAQDLAPDPDSNPAPDLDSAPDSDSDSETTEQRPAPHEDRPGGP